MLSKEFAGGVMILTGANSPTGLCSMPARYLMLDEVDAYPADAEGKGDPVDLAIRRAETFGHYAKILMTSTPSIAGLSRIEAAFDESDRRLFHVPCIHCGVYAPIAWKRIQWPDDEPSAAYLTCDACGGVMLHQDKHRLLRAGEWRPTAPGDGRTAGFHLSALYSPWRSWGDIAAEHTRVRHDPARLQVWVNAALAEVWEDQAGETTPAEPLVARREEWGELVPKAVHVLTAGVDIQADRLEVQVVGWGADEESWVIDHRIIFGDPSGPRVWSDLDGVLQGTYKHPVGVVLPIRAAAVDTGGHHTKAAYEFCRTRLARRIWAIKGRGGPGIPVWPARIKPRPGKVPLAIVGVDAAKDALFARLQKTEPGPGFIHFSRARDAEYFRQLTSERVVTTYAKGRPVRSWHARAGARNEALDTLVYAVAALHGLYAHGLRLNDERPQPPARPNVRHTIHSNWIGKTRDNWI
jgi:phage terminase large subunit GpA-like protein